MAPKGKKWKELQYLLENHCGRKTKDKGNSSKTGTLKIRIKIINPRMQKDQGGDLRIRGNFLMR